jgi:hypothetical protein
VEKIEMDLSMDLDLVAKSAEKSRRWINKKSDIARPCRTPFIDASKKNTGMKTIDK